MKAILILSLITTSIFGQRYNKIAFSDSVTICRMVSVAKTNHTGSSALYIGCDGKMTVNDSSESIKSLLQIMYDKQKEIEDISDKLTVAITFIQNYNGMVILEMDAHKYFSGLKRYYKGMGWDISVNCKCQKCIGSKAHIK